MSPGSNPGFLAPEYRQNLPNILLGHIDAIGPERETNIMNTELTPAIRKQDDNSLIVMMENLGTLHY